MAAACTNGIPHVDPAAAPRRWQRAALRFVATRPGTVLHRTVGARLDGWLLRTTRGRVTAGLGIIPLVGLISTGARSGERRHTPLVYFTDGDDVILVASSYGRSRNPSWYYNLLAHPECALRAGRHGGRFTAREVHGAERERLYALAVAHYGGYAGYAAATDGIRAIPVLRLSPAGAA
jgi:deazaflavin-dependent oxidoreductase (nitroreductase family)